MHLRPLLALVLAYLVSAHPNALAATDSAIPPKATPKSSTQTPSSSASPKTVSCPCSGPKLCVGPRGGHYCMTSGGKKRYVK